jgi:Protein of unknown function (DUF3662)/FHA domain
VVLRSFERRLERLVEGAFARAFRSGLRPIELARRLVREMDDHRTVGVNGKTLVPNHYLIQLGPEDAANFAEIQDALNAELCDALRDHARGEGYAFMGPIRVEFAVDPQRRPGTFEVVAKLRQGQGGVGAGSVVLPDGRRITLGEEVVRIGRLPDCGIQLADTNVSRHHAEIRPSGDGFLAVDLGSTNGTKVNGVRVKERLLRDADEVMVGTTRLIFHAS